MIYLEAKHKSINCVVNVCKFMQKGSIPQWADPFLCEDRHMLFFIKDPRKDDLIRVKRGDYFIYDNGRVSVAKKDEFEKNYEIHKAKREA